MLPRCESTSKDLSAGSRESCGNPRVRRAQQPCSATRIPWAAARCRTTSCTGLAVLRSNFRSVGRSAGEHDGNGAEDGDLSAALDLMAERYPNLPLWSGGFSFGSRTTCRVAAVEPRIVRIVLVALPVLAYPCDMAHQVTQPGYALMAGEDEYGTLAALEERFPELAARLETHEIPGQSHFFPGALPEVTQRIRAYAEKVLGAGSGSSSTDGTSPPSDS